MQPLDLRPSLLLFLGEDTFTAREAYDHLLGENAAVQRVLELSAAATSEEWQELLQDAFHLFTAVEMRRLRDEGRLISDTVDFVPVLIVVRGQADRFKELVEQVVHAASEQNLAERLQFVTIASTARLVEVDDLARHFHNALASTSSTSIRLQTGVLAICDYWRGARIGSEEQTTLALARIASLLSLTEYNLHFGHLGEFRNGSLGGRTFVVGLSAYTSHRMEQCADLILEDAIQQAVRALLAENTTNIVKDLTDDFYRKLLSKVPRHTGSDLSEEDRKLYQTQVAPEVLEALCSMVGDVDELTQVLERMAKRLRFQPTRPALSACVLPMFLLAVPPGIETVIVVLALVMAAGYAGFVWKLRKKDQPARVLDAVEAGIHPPSQREIDLCNPALSEVLDDLRREIYSKMRPLSRNSAAPRTQAAAEPLLELLLGEQRWGFEQMRGSQRARASARGALGMSSYRLILLALEAGKWRNNALCSELMAARSQAIQIILAELRKEFTDWAFAGEEQRWSDGNFVGEVLYGPTPSAQAQISSFSIIPRDWELTTARPVDRAAIADSFHFLYLVERP